MSTPMTVSLVIRCYTEERWNYLTAALQSVRRQTRPVLETIVVVDHNRELLACVRAGFPDAIVVENQFEPGSSGAWNSGIVAARGDVVAFLDDDATAEPDWLERLVAVYENEDVVGVGGAIEPVWLSGRPGWFPDEFLWVVGCTYRGMPEKAAPVRNLIGCNMSFRRTVFEEIGGFREDFGHKGKRALGNEETELGIRVHQRWPDRVLVYQPEARVHHFVPASRANRRYFCWRCFLEGQSKARLSLLAGRQDGLATERSYTFETLPQGVLRGLADGVRRFDLAGVGRAGAIVAGLVITTASYLAGTLSVHLKRRKEGPAHGARRV